MIRYRISPLGWALLGEATLWGVIVLCAHWSGWL